jgi:hypothetical protein
VLLTQASALTIFRDSARPQVVTSHHWPAHKSPRVEAGQTEKGPRKSQEYHSARGPPALETQRKKHMIRGR